MNRSVRFRWRRGRDLNPRYRFKPVYSLSRRAPSASRSALRNSRSIVTKQPRMGKRKFSNCLASFPPWRLRLPQRAVEGAELVVAHGAPHLEDATACQEKEAVVDQLYSGICQLIRHGGHWRQLESSLADGLASATADYTPSSDSDRLLERRRLADAHLIHKALHFFQRTTARFLTARHQTVTSQR